MMLKSLLSWIKPARKRRRLLRLRLLRAPLDHLQITLFGRQGCSCCDVARDLLEDYRARYRFHLDYVDIDTDPNLKSAYETEVPVVAVNGKVRFRGRVNPVLLNRLLEAESRPPDAAHNSVSR